MTAVRTHVIDYVITTRRLRVAVHVTNRRLPGVIDTANIHVHVFVRLLPVAQQTEGKPSFRRSRHLHTYV